MKMFTKVLLVTAAAPFAVAAVYQSSAFGSFVQKVNSAGSLTVSGKTVSLGSTGNSWTMVLSKDNMFRLKDASGEVVADGKTVTTYIKSKNAYYTEPETDSSIKDALSSSELSVWQVFFNKDALGSSSQAKDLGSSSIGGDSLNKIEVTAPSGDHRNAFLYISPSTSLPVKMQLRNGTDASSTWIVSVKSARVGSKLSASDFQFTPPADAKQISKDSLIDAKWYTDLDEAKQVAAKTGRYVFVDFMASWCGPCHMLHDQVFVTPEFKKLSKYFVFCQIDVDQQKSVAQQYNITAMPTQDILDSTGKVLDQRVGYSSPQDFYGFISKWEKPAGQQTSQP